MTSEFAWAGFSFRQVSVTLVDQKPPPRPGIVPWGLTWEPPQEAVG